MKSNRIESNQAARRLVSIDILRGIAALAVVLYHANSSRSYFDKNLLAPAFALIIHGNLGVPLFFVISGFCIHLRWARRYAATGITESPNFGQFWKRRMWRLYPPYFAALCMSMGVLALRHSQLLSIYPTWRVFFGDFAAHATMLHGVIPRFDLTGGNAVFWTLAREEYFYILYFALLPFRRRFGLLNSVFAVFGLGIAFTLVFGLHLDPSSSRWSVVDQSAITLWIQWVLGMVAVEAYYGLIVVPVFFRSWISIIPLAAAGLAADKLLFTLAPAFWGLAFFTLTNVVIDIERSGALPRSRIAKWLAAAGVCSYSIYLIHLPITARLNKAIGLPSGKYGTSSAYLIGVLVSAAIGYLAGRLFFHFIERRFISPSTPDGPVLIPLRDNSGPQAEKATGILLR